MQIALIGSPTFQNYRYMTVLSGVSIDVINCSIIGQEFTTALALFLVKVDNYQMTFKNLIVKKSVFTDSNLIFSEYSLNLNMLDSKFSENVVKTVNFDASVSA